MSAAWLLVGALGAWVVTGLLFAAPFVTRFAGRLDPNAERGSWAFRLVIVPGVVALWPLLLYRVWAGPRPIVETRHDRVSP